MTNKEIKKDIASLLKGIIPNGWKYSLSTAFSGYSAIIKLTIQQADIDLLDVIGRDLLDVIGVCDMPVLKHHMTRRGIEENIISLFDNINKALHHKNYFDYVYVNLGKYDKPFMVVK
jgi:hypothetical protein